ncbi:hypothetical protein [Aquipuribacter nitratireducens]|uniref:Uncharacterized protein n=1 Tax=Aquipuribacter nitratireducens TaxID=650104 RepID=A0ABW0GQP9_9MICO
MGAGGIILLVIVGLWAVYLVPVLVSERAARLENRDGDRSSAAVRVLERPAAQRPSHRVVLTADRPVVSDRLPARPTPDLAATLRERSRRDRLVTRVRGLAALAGLVGLLVTGVLLGVGVVPWWAPVLAGGWLVGAVASGAVAAASTRRRRSPVVRTAADLPPRARRVATEVFDARAGRSGAPLAPRPARPAASEVARPAERAAETSDGTWTPAEVPAPVYATKPVSHRPPALPWSLPPVALGDAEPIVSSSRPQAPVEAPSAEQAEATGDEQPERRSAAG